jgi:hypothetical protein
MANTVYNKALEAFLTGAINWTSANVSAALVTSAYTFNQAHQYFSSVTGQLGSSVVLTGKSATDGVADAGDVSFTGITGTAAAVVLFVDTGNPATSSLIAFIDTATGLPAVASGQTVNVQWDNTANRIFKL